MNLVSTCILTALVLSLSSLRGYAQEVEVGRFEVGAQLTGLGALGEGIQMRALAGPRITVNLSRRNALEISGDLMTPSFNSGSTYGLYFLQYKRLLNARSVTSPNTLFVTAGTGGYFFHSRIGERHQRRVDGSTVVYPARSESTLSGTQVATFNVGVEHRLNRQFAARLEAGALALVAQNGYVGFRMLAGIVMPIGGYRAPTN